MLEDIKELLEKILKELEELNSKKVKTIEPYKCPYETTSISPWDNTTYAI